MPGSLLHTEAAMASKANVVPVLRTMAVQCRRDPDADLAEAMMWTLSTNALELKDSIQGGIRSQLWWAGVMARVNRFLFESDFYSSSGSWAAQLPQPQRTRILSRVLLPSTAANCTAFLNTARRHSAFILTPRASSDPFPFPSSSESKGAACPSWMEYGNQLRSRLGKPFSGESSLSWYLSTTNNHYLEEQF